MAGAACVVGLMHALAARKAKVNAVGVIGLVENMPDGNAQRPGRHRHVDVRPDHRDHQHRRRGPPRARRRALVRQHKRFKPQFMIDLATLTGAIIVALGQEYAGMFSNDDELCRAADQGRARRPASGCGACRSAPEYDKMIDSKFADMKNTGGRAAAARSPRRSSSQRFVDKTPWAHLDIAGTALRLAADRHQQELGLGLGRAAARPAGGGSLREVSWTRETHDRNPVLPPATPAARRRAAGAAGEIARARLARWSCRRRRKSASRRSTRICGPIATTASCRTAPGARRRRRSSRCCSPLDDDNPNGADGALPDRRRAGAGGRRRPISASCCCSTARTTTRSPLRASAGATPRRRASTSPIGSRTSSGRWVKKA